MGAIVVPLECWYINQHRRRLPFDITVFIVGSIKEGYNNNLSNLYLYVYIQPPATSLSLSITRFFSRALFSFFKKNFGFCVLPCKVSFLYCCCCCCGCLSSFSLSPSSDEIGRMKWAGRPGSRANCMYIYQESCASILYINVIFFFFFLPKLLRWCSYK